MSNTACKIYKEQMEMLLSLPNQEEAKNILYQALVNSYNQFDNQFDNQNENAYISISLSILSINILNLLSKNIVWKEFSSNYGGARKGAGKPKDVKKGNTRAKQVKFTPPTLEEVKDYAKSKNRLDLAEKFWNYFNASDWVDSNGRKVVSWKAKFITWESHTEKPREQLPRTYWIE